MSGINTDASNNNNSIRRCESEDCCLSDHLAQTSIQKTREITLVTHPKVIREPTLVDGYTAVFKLDGTSAKLYDLKNPQDAQKPPETIYRIVPNTHAHMVNYVVIDQDCDSMRKIKEKDPATMLKLLESQRQSADQMLQKLMSGYGQIMGVEDAVMLKKSQQQQQLQPNYATRHAASYEMPPVASSVMTSTLGGNNVAATNYMPQRTHPNLKITAVAGADSLPATLAAAPIVAPPPPAAAPPIITPVPLANLQNVLPSAPAAAAPNIVPSAAAAAEPVVLATPSTDGMDKMKAELEELRRTVALLAEAQAKSQQQQQQQPTNSKQITRKR